VNWLALVHRSVTAGPGTGSSPAGFPGWADPAVCSRQYGSCPSVPILKSVSEWPAGSSRTTRTVTVKNRRSCSCQVRTRQARRARLTVAVGLLLPAAIACLPLIMAACDVTAHR
jgi:hypothetical protein